MLRSGRKMICFLMTVILLFSAAAPAMAASAAARVTSGSAKFYRYPSTSSARVHIKKGTTVTVTAVKSGWAKVKCKGITGYMKTSALGSVAKKAARTSWKSKVVMLNWYSGGSSVLKKGGYGYLYDVKTGVRLRIKRMGGSSHADCEPATAKDTAKLKKIAGGSFSWDSHACILYAGGKFVACAINTMPHGDQTITNNGYNGQFCLHMLGSKTHGSDSVNSEHQSAIRKAYNWAH